MKEGPKKMQSSLSDSSSPLPSLHSTGNGGGDDEAGEGGAHHEHPAHAQHERQHEDVAGREELGKEPGAAGGPVAGLLGEGEGADGDGARGGGGEGGHYGAGGVDELDAAVGARLQADAHLSQRLQVQGIGGCEVLRFQALLPAQCQSLEA